MDPGKPNIRIFLVIATLLLTNLAQAFPKDHGHRHESLTLEDEFYSDFPSCLLHDSRGFMWFGARDGLKRYDGYGFKSYFHSDFDTVSLSDNYVISMQEDQHGNIWIGTMNGGLNQYDREKDAFTRIPGSWDDPFNLRITSVFAICVLRSGEIWFSAQSSFSQGVYRLEPGTGKIRPFTHDRIHASEVNTISATPDIIRTRSILEDEKGDIWIGDTEGIHQYDPLDGSIIHYRNNPADPNSISSDTIHSIYEDGKGNLWVGTDNGLYRMDRNRNIFYRYHHDPINPNSLRSNYVGAITEDFDGNLIIRTPMGMDFLETQTENFSCWELTDSIGSDFNVFLVQRQLCHDGSGIIWFATSQFFHKLIPEKAKFSYAIGEGFAPAFTHFDPNGEIWLGTWAYGLYKTIPDGSGNPYLQLQDFMSDGVLSRSELFHYPNNLEDPFSLHSDYITAICRDHEGTLWIGGCETGTLYALDRANGMERFIPFMKDTTPRTSMWRLTRIFEDRNRNLWIGGDTRLDVFERDERRFYQYMLDPPGQAFKNSLLVNDICEDDSGSVWVGTWFHGLFRIVPPVTLSQSGTARGAETISYKYDPDLPKDLGDCPVL